MTRETGTDCKRNWAAAVACAVGSGPQKKGCGETGLQVWKASGQGNGKQARKQAVGMRGSEVEAEKRNRAMGMIGVMAPVRTWRE